MLELRVCATTLNLYDGRNRTQVFVHAGPVLYQPGYISSQWEGDFVVRFQGGFSDMSSVGTRRCPLQLDGRWNEVACVIGGESLGAREIWL